MHLPEAALPEAVRPAADLPATVLPGAALHRPTAPGRPDRDEIPDRSIAARQTIETRNDPRGRVASFQVHFRSWEPNYANRWHSYLMAKEIDRVRAQSALAVIKQHPGMVLFAVSPVLIGVGLVWWLVSPALAVLLLIGAVVGGGAVLLMKR